MARPLRALRVPVMGRYVLRPGLDNTLIGSLRSVWLFRRFALGGLRSTLQLRFRACGALAIAGFAGSQLVGCRLASADFCG